jgi:plastocyanin
VTFSPAALTIQQCDTVVWENSDGIHNVVADNAHFDSGEPASPPWVYSFVFENVTPGSYQYHCELHVDLGMTGTVTVLATDPQLHLVNVAGLSFTPPNLTITQGDTVRWSNTGGTHNAHQIPEDIFLSGSPAPAPWTYEFIFNNVAAGVYDYRCDLHFGLGMLGTVTVEPDLCPPHPPLDVVISRSGDDIVLTWTAVPNATDYEIFTSADPTLPEFVTSAGATAATSFTHTGILVGTAQLFYQVRARL